MGGEAERYGRRMWWRKDADLLAVRKQGVGEGTSEESKTKI